jgi:tetratricopeptide (TPR) repeat protein
VELADPARSYAVLIGSSSYADPALEDLPAVANNLTRLGELLEDPTVWGLPPGHCVRVPEPASPAEALDAVHDAARRADDTLLVYYAGHGLSDAAGLLLALPSTDPQRAYTSVDFDALRREVLGVRRDANRIVVLDCCYSGSALIGGMGGGMNGPVEMAEQSRIAGSYLLTASAATRQALAPPGETYTAFTGELIRLLDQGLPGGDGLIEVTRIYERLHGELRAKGRPLPQQRLSNTGRTLAIARNRYGAARAAAPSGKRSSEKVPSPAPEPLAVQVRDELSPALKETLRWKPHALADEYTRLLKDETQSGDAVELVRLAALSRPVQEVAALVVLLDRGAWHPAFHQVAGRGPQAVVECLEALYALDRAEDLAEPLILAVATHPPQDGVSVVQALRAAGYPAEKERLLSVITAGTRSTDYFLELLGALWSAELNTDADRVLAEVTTASDEDAAQLADALLAIGRHEKAFELYARAAAVVARRPVRELIRVLGALDGAEEDCRERARRVTRSVNGTDDHGGSAAGEERLAAQLHKQADILLWAALDADESPSAIGELSEALWSAGMNGRALRALARSAESLSPDAVVELADILRDSGHDDGVRHLLRAATLGHPVGMTAFFVDALREMGWPVDANRLLADAAVRPVEEVVALAVWCTEHDRERDRARLVSAVGRRPVPERLAVVRTLLAVPGDHDDFIAPLALAPDEDFAEVLETLRDQEDARGLVTLLAYQVRADRPAAIQRLDFLTRAEGAFATEKAVLAVLLASGDVLAGVLGDVRATPPSPAEITSLVGATAPLAARVYATSALCAAGHQDKVVMALVRTAVHPATQEAVEWLAALDAHSLTDCVHALIRSRRLSEGTAPGLADLVAGLGAAGMHEAASFALQRFAFTLGPQRTSDLARSIAPPPVPTPYGPVPPFLFAPPRET